MVAAPNLVSVPDELIWQLAGKAAAAMYPRVKHLDYSMSEEDLLMIAAGYLYTNLHKFRPETASFGTWGYRRAVGAIVDHYRRQTRYRPGRPNTHQLLVYPAWDAKWVENYLGRQATSDDNPDDGPDLADLDILRFVIRELPYAQQGILFYTVGLNMSNQECADLMGYSRQWVKALRNRALETLRVYFEEVKAGEFIDDEDASGRACPEVRTV